VIDDFTLTPPPTGDEPNARELERVDTARRHYLKTIDVMHRRYGVASDGVTCGACAYLERHDHGSRSYPKCTAFRVSRSEATDWRVRWPACGKFRQAKEASYAHD
jgi:hypothetical protein